jgi:hypothetical protein
MVAMLARLVLLWSSQELWRLKTASTPAVPTRSPITQRQDADKRRSITNSFEKRMSIRDRAPMALTASGWTKRESSRMLSTFVFSRTDPQVCQRVSLYLKPQLSSGEIVSLIQKRVHAS